MSTQSNTIPATAGGPTLEAEAAALEAAATAVPDPILADEPVTPERPEWLPEKFATVEDMAKAYAELEKGKSKPADVPEDEAEVADKAITAAGLDMEALSAEWAEKGELTPESLEALGKQGITPEMVKSYVAGQTAEATATRKSLLDPVGGEEAYTDMVGWAADNLNEAEIDAFNSVLESGDPNATKMAVENLHSKYTSANGSEPKVSLNGRGTPSSGATYGTTADLMKDMQNPEYKNNASFRAKVEAKLERSSIM